jgi:hypothetical protein
MGPKSESKRQRLESLLSEDSIRFIDELAWERIGLALTPVSQSYLRKLVREAGVAMAPLVEGVRQDSLTELERTLSALQEEYEPADPAGKGKYRAAVIQAKDHARWALRKTSIDAETKRIKEEMLLWMMTWLENPTLFHDWLAIRKRSLY